MKGLALKEKKIIDAQKPVLPQSWTSAAGVLRYKAQALKRHIAKTKKEWR